MKKLLLFSLICIGIKSHAITFTKIVTTVVEKEGKKIRSVEFTSPLLGRVGKKSVAVMSPMLDMATNKFSQVGRYVLNNQKQSALFGSIAAGSYLGYRYARKNKLGTRLHNHLSNNYGHYIIGSIALATPFCFHEPALGHIKNLLSLAERNRTGLVAGVKVYLFLSAAKWVYNGLFSGEDCS